MNNEMLIKKIIPKYLVKELNSRGCKYSLKDVIKYYQYYSDVVDIIFNSIDFIWSAANCSRDIKINNDEIVTVSIKGSGISMVSSKIGLFFCRWARVGDYIVNLKMEAVIGYVTVDNLSRMEHLKNKLFFD